MQEWESPFRSHCSSEGREETVHFSGRKKRLGFFEISKYAHLRHLILRESASISLTKVWDFQPQAAATSQGQNLLISMPNSMLWHFMEIIQIFWLYLNDRLGRKDVPKCKARFFIKTFWLWHLVRQGKGSTYIKLLCNRCKWYIW